MGGTPGEPKKAALIAVIVIVGLAVVLLVLPDSLFPDPALVTNLLALVTAALAAGCMAWRALRSTGRYRSAWAALSGSLGCWALGQAIWIILQATGHASFPSVADVAYLGFGPLACLGLLRMPTGRVSGQRLQVFLDGLAVSLALLLISWQTALGAAIESADGAQATVAAIYIGYPLIDVAVLVIAVLTLARTPVGSARLPLTLLAAGLCAVSVADSSFVYLVATVGYEPGYGPDVAWNIGFGLLAVAALLDRTGRQDAEPADPATAVLPAGGLLPYVPVAMALAVVVVARLVGEIVSPVDEIAALGLIVLLLVRQYLTLRQNARLANDLEAREADLRHQAHHDALTGLANRLLFRERLEHALRLHARDRRPIAVLFLDLDDFKTVNDTLGHTVGDHLLIGIARRLADVVRATDLVARLGGDEFAILVESGDDPHRMAARIAARLREPVLVGQHALRASASTGVIQLTADDPPIPTEDLMAQADIAMYATKRGSRTHAAAR